MNKSAGILAAALAAMAIQVSCEQPSDAVEIVPLSSYFNEEAAPQVLRGSKAVQCKQLLAEIYANAPSYKSNPSDHSAKDVVHALAQAEMPLVAFSYRDEDGDEMDSYEIMLCSGQGGVYVITHLSMDDRELTTENVRRIEELGISLRAKAE